MRIYYHITTKEPLVLSQTTATTNNHLGLDYIPGSAILGAMAQRVYSQLSDEQSFAIFHSGAVRFGPAYPAVNNEIALPVPAAWHTQKLDDQLLSNHAATSFVRDDKVQYKQQRNGYITSQNVMADVKQGLTTRTALDDQQNVIDGQLYTYAIIEAGQSFSGWIDVENEALWQLIKPLLNGEFNIGRSRSSEFGRVSIYSDLQSSSQPTAQNLANHLVVWCLSDAQCIDEHGQATFAPSLANLINGASGTLNANKSFVRSKKLRRFNRARGGLDSEQQLITAGSVLVYDLEQPLTDTQLASLQAKGIGINQQQGLGWVAVNPLWAAEAEPKGNLFTAIEVKQPAKKDVFVSVDSKLTKWVAQLAAIEQVQQANDAVIEKIHRQIIAAYENARSYNNIPKSYQYGPSMSQWRRLDTLVKNEQNWQAKAFNDSDGVCKAKNDEHGWGASWQDEQGFVTFEAFANAAFAHIDYLVMRKLLEQLCRFDPSITSGLTDYKKSFSAKAQQGGQA